MSTENQAPLFIELKAKALEDLHTGTGTGSGDIDALVMRDRQGRPVIRASHFKGLLREAGEELIALAETEALREQKKQALFGLLGTQGTMRSALNLTSLRVEKNAGTLIWGSSARVANGRAPLEDTLRYVEHVAGGTRFQATLRLADPSQKAFLETLLRRVDRIGGDRNRGSGLVRLDWKDRAAVKSTEPEPETKATRIQLVLRNLEPLCLPATGHPGNLILGQSFIRGQTLRGALMAWAIRTGRTRSLDLFQRLSVGDALPLPEGIDTAVTVLPIPLSILTPKPEGGTPDLPWWAVGAAEPAARDGLYRERQEGEEKPKRPGTHEYLCRENPGGPWLRYTPTMNVRLRNATPKRNSQSEANLFSQEEIAEDTCFQSELRFADPKDAAAFFTTFAQLLGGDWLQVGRGGKPMVAKPIDTANLTATAPDRDEWSLTLTSDLIARGPNLGFLDDLDIGDLCKLAGIPEPAEHTWKISGRTVETERLCGFNAVTGLQRAPVLALRRGSCWRIDGEGSRALAAALIAKGALGERTQEGLGRFLIGTEPFSKLVKPKGAAVPLTECSNEALLASALDLSRKIPDNGPSLSQLQWLREQALAATSLEALNKLLNEIATAPKRRPQGGKAWGNFPVMPLKDALKKLENPDKEKELKAKKHLISHLVQWRAPEAKEQRR